MQNHIRPIIPVSEYPERWEKVQAMMAEKGLDFLVAYADDRAAFGRLMPAGWRISRFILNLFASLCPGKGRR